MNHMNVRFATALLVLCCAQATLTGTTTYSMGTNINTSFDTNGYTEGVWTENDGTANQQIVCVVGFTVANETNTCGNPGPGTSQHISITTGGQPANTAILPAWVTNYAEIDGDPTYGAPISTEMTGLTVGGQYQVTFYQASNEEDGNNKAYTDTWQVYVIPNTTTGTYMCPESYCPTVTNPDPTDLAFTSAAMNNAGSVSTPWTLQTFTFTATSATEVLEFVTSAIGTSGFEPPLFDLAGVSTSQVTPEPGTWLLTLIGAGLVVGAGKMRRRTKSASFKRVKNG